MTDGHKEVRYNGCCAVEALWVTKTWADHAIYLPRVSSSSSSVGPASKWKRTLVSNVGHRNGFLVQFVFIINLCNCTLHLANGQDLYLCSGATDRACLFCMRMSIVLVQEERLSGGLAWQMSLDSMVRHIAKSHFFRLIRNLRRMSKGGD